MSVIRNASDNNHKISSQRCRTTLLHVQVSRIPFPTFPITKPPRLYEGREARWFVIASISGREQLNPVTPNGASLNGNAPIIRPASPDDSAAFPVACVRRRQDCFCGPLSPNSTARTPGHLGSADSRIGSRSFPIDELCQCQPTNPFRPR